MPITTADMNVKGLIGNIPNEIRPVKQADRLIKSDQTHDRDANGQQMFSGEQQQHREPMSEEQLEVFLERLRDLPGVKEHHWTIEVEKNETGRFVLVKDNLSNVIRRIPESDLWTLEADGDRANGHLLKKTA